MKPSEKSYAQETADRLRKEGNFKDADVDVNDVIQIIEDDEAFIAALRAKLKVAEDALKEVVEEFCANCTASADDRRELCDQCVTCDWKEALAAIRGEGGDNAH